MIERAVILSSGDSIGVADLSESVQPSSEMRLGGRFTLEAIENEHIRGVIATTRSLEEAAVRAGDRPRHALPAAQEAGALSAPRARMAPT